VGIGATLPLHCDVVYLGESARLRFPFAALGLVPEAASSLLLPLLIGPQPAAEVLLSAEWVHAPRALELGLAARVLPDAEVLEATLARAAEIAVHPVGALRAIKQLLLAPRTDLVRVTLDREMKSMAERVGTPENLEALRAFFARKG
jgi:enoyl-CoA hydratase/carnithine racemase